MDKYKILIVGHGSFPTGALSAASLIVGEQAHVSSMNIDEEQGHDKLEDDIKDFLDKNDNVIMFADFTGGAPHKIGARAIAAAGKKTQFIVSGAPFSFLIQAILMTPETSVDPEEAKEFVKNTLAESLKTAMVMPR